MKPRKSKQGGDHGLREIVIVSGKGGVGKSSLTGSLAVLLQKKGISLTAVDADVDAPNLAIVLGEEISAFQEIKASEKITIDYAKCIKCGKCILSCKFDAILENEPMIPTLVPFLCEGCGACIQVCPASAITMNKVANGRIGSTETRYGFPLISGQLYMGESASGHIVSAVKAKGKSIAEERAHQLLLVDGPPGIGCPVISSIAGADYALVVTEPTPAARNSLDRIIKVLTHFRVRSEVVINRVDLAPEFSEIMAEWIENTLKTPVLERIPYDENIPLSLSQRIPVVEYKQGSISSKALKNIADHITKSL